MVDDSSQDERQVNNLPTSSTVSPEAVPAQVHNEVADELSAKSRTHLKNEAQERKAKREEKERLDLRVKRAQALQPWLMLLHTSITVAAVGVAIYGYYQTVEPTLEKLRAQAQAEAAKKEAKQAKAEAETAKNERQQAVEEAERARAKTEAEVANATALAESARVNAQQAKADQARVEQHLRESHARLKASEQMISAKEREFGALQVRYSEAVTKYKYLIILEFLQAARLHCLPEEELKESWPSPSGRYPSVSNGAKCMRELSGGPVSQARRLRPPRDVPPNDPMDRRQLATLDRLIKARFALRELTPQEHTLIGEIIETAAREHDEGKQDLDVADRVKLFYTTPYARFELLLVRHTTRKLGLPPLFPFFGH